MASVIVVENELKDSINEYALIIDAVHKNTELSDSLKAFVGDDVSDKTEVASKLLNASTKETLSSLGNKEFEPTFYLLVYLISQLELLSIDQVFARDAKILDLLVQCTPFEEPSLRDRKSLKSLTILSALNTFFNLLPASSKNRIQVIEAILKIVSETKGSFALIQSPIGDNLVSYLQLAGATEDEIKKIFWSFVALDQNYTLGTLNIIKKFTSTFSLNLKELHQLIEFALSSSVVDVSYLVNNNVAAAMRQHSSDELVVVFSNYTKGNLISSVPSSIKGNVSEKSKILALTKFFVDNSESHRNKFKYDDIPKDLAPSAAAFEKLLIDSIKAGVIEGKLNQVDETFFLVRANRFIMAGEDQKLAQDWDVIKQTLTEWKYSLENINEIVLNAKENIVNNNNNN